LNHLARQAGDSASRLLDFCLAHLLARHVVQAARTAVGVAVLSSAVPYSLEMCAEKIPEHTFGVLMSIEPAIGALSGSVFLSEKLASLQWIAIGLIMLASVGCTLSSGKQEPASELIP
jgi:inner membrane transporter RhtA